MEKNDLILENGMKRFQQIMEYTLNRNSNIMGEAGDKDNQETLPSDGEDIGADDPNMGGMPGGDPGIGGNDAGMPGGDPGMGAGDPGIGAGDPGMSGGDGQQTPDGFNPQGGDDMQMDAGLDPNMGTDGADTMQPDDEVIDVDELTDAQEDTEHEVEKLGGKFDKVLKAIGAFEELLRANDEKIENLKTEFEKRNPTQIEKLSMQTAKSYPFNVTPEEYWKEKEATSNYSTEDDNNGKEQGQYVITKNDVNGATNWKEISDSLGEDDFMYNQTLNKILSM